ncbi:hypothetical protein SAMN05421770_101152 [Granulicella rosea]|uniref:Uncharacterized protein n=1 Tax=Granulicella rosea TaxID=474952 RepID=A0A239CYF9_9BACT|nr:hypothetical protein [Granulicella rosea]SNS24383.1 hypothetical protein SAMN05421770_101152 [Granulicella rosea]
MQITIDIPDELVADVKARGLTPEDVMKSLIADLGATLHSNAAPRLNDEEFNASLDALAQFSSKIPILPKDAFSRERFYEDHD